MRQRRKPLPPGLAQVFTRSAARELGVSDRRLRYDDVERVGRGLYRRVPQARAAARPDVAASSPVAALPRDHTEGASAWREQQLADAQAHRVHLPLGAFFCGSTAALIWGLPVAPPPGGPGRSLLEIGVHAPRRAPRQADFAAHSIRPVLARVVEHRGMPLTDPASTWAMLAPSLPPHDAVALGDAVIRQHRVAGTDAIDRPPLATIDDLRAAAALRRTGAQRLRQLLPLLSPRSASPPESVFRMLLREWGAPEPELDYDVFDADGQFIGCSEFAYPLYRLAFEYESEFHRVDRRQWNRDIEKYHHYRMLDWEVVRVNALLLYRERNRLRHLALDALRRRGWSGETAPG